MRHSDKSESDSARRPVDVTRKTGKISTQVAILIIVIAISFVIVGFSTWRTFDYLRINGKVYEQIVDGKNIVADILPPPLYVVEANLIVYQIVLSKSENERTPLLARLEVLKQDFVARQMYWSGRQLDSAVRDQLLNQDAKSAQQFFDAVEGQLIPAVRGGNKGDVERAMSSVQKVFAKHRSDIEATVAVTNQMNDKLEKFAAERVANDTLEMLAVFVASVVVSLVLLLRFRRLLLRQLGGEPFLALAVTKRLAVGDLSSKIELQNGDESSLMANMNILSETMQRLAYRADAIGKGDLSAEIELLSEHDRLGKAINNMILMLRASRTEDEQRNWHKDGQSQLSTALAGDLTPEQLANDAIGLLGRYLEAGRGVFYLYMNETEQLELIGSYMYTEYNNFGARFALGEGAIGQVAREKKPIILKVVANETAPVVTGTTNSLPRYTYTYPLLHEDELLGVIELASFECYDEQKIEFLVNAAGMLATLLNIAEQRTKIRKLLAATEASEQEARLQSNQLRESNTIMEEQQQLLQQQSEELQQTNTQMEEQQQQLEQQNRALMESRQATEDKAKQLELSSKYKSDFLANMSHELRTPLNSIILLSKMMASGEAEQAEGEQIKWAQVIHHSGEDLLRLINDVLDLSKIEAGRMDLQIGPVNSESLCSELQEMFKHVAKDKGLTFTVEDKLQGEFLTDKDKLAQILRNLLSNALKFTKQGDVALIISRHSGPLPIRLSVRDSGIGIPEEKKALIFEAFQQADGSTAREFGGTGLGLTISLRFAQLMGGTIELQSAPGQGSEFSVLLPDTPPAPATASAARTTLQSATDRTLTQPPPVIRDDRDNLHKDDQVILLIDDDPVLGQTLLTINRRLGYKTLLAHTGTDGLEMARHYRPQGILLDLGLPDMDGVKVLHEIKSRHELARIPVYIVSARDRDDALLQQGAIGYLQKPADEQRLTAAETTLLGAVAAKAANSAILVVENGGLTAAEVVRIVGSAPGLVVAATPDTALLVLRQHIFRLVIIDLADASVQPGLNIAAEIRADNPDFALIFFARQAPSSVDEAKLRRYSDSIIVKAQQADRRLLENVERFLREVPGERASLQAEHNAGAASKNLVGKHILLVDDDPRNLFVITAALERNGAKVTDAVNGRRALEFLEKQRVDLIISDIMMPEMDGYQLIAAIRGNPALADIPMLIITAKALPADRDKIFSMGADDYMTKPVDYDVLLSKTAQWCASRAA